MNLLLKQKAFLIEIISILILFIGIALDHWSVSTTLFYFNFELALLLLLAVITSFASYNKSQPGPILFGGMIVLLGTLGSSYWLTVKIGDYIPITDRSQNNFEVFMSERFANLWPLLILVVLASTIKLVKLSKDKKEVFLIESLFLRVFSLILITLIGGYIITHFPQPNTRIIIALIMITVRIALEFYLYRSVLNWNPRKNEN